MHIVTYIHAATISENGGRESQRKQGRIYGRVWKEERKGMNDTVIISKNKDVILKHQRNN